MRLPVQGKKRLSHSGRGKSTYWVLTFTSDSIISPGSGVRGFTVPSVLLSAFFIGAGFPGRTGITFASAMMPAAVACFGLFLRGFAFFGAVFTALGFCSFMFGSVFRSLFQDFSSHSVDLVAVQQISGCEADLVDNSTVFRFAYAVPPVLCPTAGSRIFPPRPHCPPER